VSRQRIHQLAAAARREDAQATEGKGAS
jgi:hypothetical protein